MQFPLSEFLSVNGIYHNGNRKFYPTYKGNAKARRAKMKRRRKKRGW